MRRCPYRDLGVPTPLDEATSAAHAWVISISGAAKQAQHSTDRENCNGRSCHRQQTVQGPVQHRAVAADLQRREHGQEMARRGRSEEHTSELPSLMRSSYAVFCFNKKTNKT